MTEQPKNPEHILDIALELADEEKAMTEQTRITTETVWKLLIRGERPQQIQQKLGITREQYKNAIYTIVTTTKPNNDDINRERKLAHDRYLNIYRKLHDQYDEAEKPSEISMIAKELRATIKEIGDIYSIKMADKLEIDININERQQANETIQRLLDKMRNQTAIEGEIIDDEDEHTDREDPHPDS